MESAPITSVVNRKVKFIRANGAAMDYLGSHAAEL